MKTIMKTIFCLFAGLLIVSAAANAEMIGVKYFEDVGDTRVESLDAINLAEVVGRGFPIARNFSSDLARVELESVVGRGFISKLTPEEIGRIDAQGFLPSPEELSQMTRDLVEISIKGITIVIDKSNYSRAELVAVVEGWEKFLATI